FFCIACSRDHRGLHSFPTRRSSDLNIALMLGQGISGLIVGTGLVLPAFVGSLLGGIVLRAAGDLLAPQGGRMWRFDDMRPGIALDRKSTRLNSSHVKISYAVFCLKK